MDTDASMTLLVVGLAAYLVAVAVILGGLLLANWHAGRKRVSREQVTANPNAGRELVRVGYRVRTNYHRCR